MSDRMIMPKPGTYFRLGEKVYKSFDDGGEFGCNRCVFNQKRGCEAPENLFCKDLYFEDHTHQLQDVELVHETTSKFYPIMSAIVVGLIMLGIVIYNFIN